jgi:hypothetical protein
MQARRRKEIGGDSVGSEDEDGGGRMQSLIVHPTNSATVTLTVDAAHGQALDVAAMKSVRRAMGTLYARLMVSVKQLCQRDKGHWMLLAPQHDAVRMYAHAQTVCASAHLCRRTAAPCGSCFVSLWSGRTRLVAAVRSCTGAIVTVAFEACVMLLAAIVYVRGKCDVGVRVSIQADITASLSSLSFGRV